MSSSAKAPLWRVGGSCELGGESSELNAWFNRGFVVGVVGSLAVGNMVLVSSSEEGEECIWESASTSVEGLFSVLQ